MGQTKAVDLVPFSDWVWYQGLDRVVCRNDETAEGKRSIMLTDPMLNVFTLTVSPDTIFDVTDDYPVTITGFDS